MWFSSDPAHAGPVISGTPVVPSSFSAPETPVSPVPNGEPRRSPDAVIPALLSALDPGVSLSEELNLGAFVGAVSAALSAGEAGSSGPGGASGYLLRQECLEPEQYLAHAIILQAAEDWRKAMGILFLRPDDREALRLRRQTERFFRSPWCDFLSDLLGDHLKGSRLLDLLLREWALTHPAPPAPPVRRRSSSREKSRQRRAAAASSRRRGSRSPIASFPAPVLP